MRIYPTWRRQGGPVPAPGTCIRWFPGPCRPHRAGGGEGRSLGFLLANRLLHLRESEVEDLHLPVGGNEDVIGLEVAVHDTLGVRRRQARRPPPYRSRTPFLPVHPARGDSPALQVLAFEKLGDREGDALDRHQNRRWRECLGGRAWRPPWLPRSKRARRSGLLSHLLMAAP